MVTAVFSLLLILEAALAFQSHPFSFGAQWKPLQQLNQASSSIDEDEDHTLSMKRRGTLRELCFGVPVAVSTIAAALLPAQPVFGLSAEDAAKAYDFYAETYDKLDGGQAASLFGIDEARTNLLQRAKGDVLEVGVGTGLNLDKYDPNKITSLTLVDISGGMLREAERRKATLDKLNRVPVKFIKADATTDLVKLFGPQSFDSVVDTFSLCVFGNDGAKKSLKEMKQVVKSSGNGGQVLLLENSRSSNPILGLYQDATAEQAASIGGKGCIYNQDVVKLIQESGMKISEETRYAAGLFRSYVCTTN